MRFGEKFRCSEGDCVGFNANAVEFEGYAATRVLSPAGGMGLGTDSAIIYSSLLGKEISASGDLFDCVQKINSGFRNGLIKEGLVGFTSQEYFIANYMIEHSYEMKEAHVKDINLEWLERADSFSGNADPLRLKG